MGQVDENREEGKWREEGAQARALAFEDHSKLKNGELNNCVASVAHQVFNCASNYVERDRKNESVNACALQKIKQIWKV